MMRSRSDSDSDAQAAISVSDRRHPWHKPVTVSMTQTLTHGVRIPGSQSIGHSQRPLYTTDENRHYDHRRRLWRGHARPRKPGS